MPILWIVMILVAIAVVGIGLLYSLTPIPSDQMNPAHDALLTIADWMVKSSIGALLGFTGAVRLSARNGK